MLAVGRCAARIFHIFRRGVGGELLAGTWDVAEGHPAFLGGGALRVSPQKAIRIFWKCRTPRGTSKKDEFVVLKL